MLVGFFQQDRDRFAGVLLVVLGGVAARGVHGGLVGGVGIDFDGGHEERRVYSAVATPAFLGSGERSLMEVALAFDDRVCVTARLAPGWGHECGLPGGRGAGRTILHFA